MPRYHKSKWKGMCNYLIFSLDKLQLRFWKFWFEFPDYNQFDEQVRYFGSNTSR